MQQQGNDMSQKPFRKILTDWIGEMYVSARERLPDGTPKMGKFESEELYRQGQRFLQTPEVEPKFGELTNAQRERLEMLAEEAAEVAKACTKILRHGYHSYNPDIPNHASNGDDLEQELLDLWCVAERMMVYGDIRQLNFFDSAKRWVKKLRYAHHQPPFSHPTLQRDDK